MRSKKNSEMNYKVYQTEKRKPLQMCDIILIKPWKDDEVL